ncbi:hypothetical protein VV02_07180 [Luteipulveratus mongoliensis]|uniref:Permease n=1 Tax=Luteipulveratus mongoliensis TaxID=571913 RepID=A0A0K1JGG5_9MICO|nr:hypothetical protein VV02_07180 [Luteipulveratus mongoliensis]
MLTPVATLSALVVCAVLALGAAASELSMAGALLFAVLVLALGWPHLLDLPSPRGVQLILIGTAVVLAAISELGDDERGLRWLPTVLGGGLIAAFLHQLVRQDGRARLVATLAGTCLGLGVLGSGAFFLSALDENMGEELVLACLAASAIGMIVDWVLHRFGATAEWAVPISMVLSGGAAFVLAQSLDVTWSAMVLVAAGTPLVSHAVRRLLSFAVGARGAAGQLALGAASVLASGVVAYAVAWFYR